MNLDNCADHAYQCVIEGVGVSVNGLSGRSGSHETGNASVLREIDCEVNALEHVLTAIQDKVRSRLSHIRRRRNNITSPFYRLPTECIQGIFETVQSDGNGFAVHRIRLWSHFRVNEREEKIPRLLRMSKNVPLVIPSYRFSPEQFIPHLHRIQSFKSQYEDTIHPSDFQAFLQSPAPMLERLVIQSSHTYPDTIHRPLFAGQAPRLRHLSIRPFRIAWDSFAFLDLRNLSTTDWGDGMEDWELRYHRLLSYFPNLERLEIVQQHSGHHVKALQLGSPGSDTVKLTKLSSLSLQGISCATLTGVLSMMSTTVFQNLFATINKHGGAEAIAPIYKLPTFPTFQTIICHLTWISINCKTDPGIQILMHETEDHLKKQIPGYSLRLDFTNKSNSPLLDPLIPFLNIMLKAAPIKSVHAAGKIFQEGPGFTQILARLVGLEELLIVNSMDLSNIIRSLSGSSNETSDPSLPVSWPYPKLRKLHFSHVLLDISALLVVLKQRFGNSSRGANGYPTPLAELVLTSSRYQGALNKGTVLELIDLMKSHGGTLSYGY